MGALWHFRWQGLTIPPVWVMEFWCIGLNGK
jgi:hypothetical protein